LKNSKNNCQKINQPDNHNKENQLRIFNWEEKNLSLEKVLLEDSHFFPETVYLNKMIILYKLIISRKKISFRKAKKS
jgi:hypothetical protein